MTSGSRVERTSSINVRHFALKAAAAIFFIPHSIANVVISK
jgi:hypothetical protein